LLKGVEFPLITTLDTSKTPKAGDVRIAAPVMAAAEIAKLKTRLAQIESGRRGKPTARRGKPKRSSPTIKAAPKPRPTKTACAGDPIAAAIICARMTAGLTQQQLAERLKTDQANVAPLENSRTEATVRSLKRIAAATGHRLMVDLPPAKGNARFDVTGLMRLCMSPAV
jgi:ribosome-binding protein aMBF1 (putative translation factor)